MTTEWEKLEALMAEGDNEVAVDAIFGAWPRIQVAIAASRALVDECEGCQCATHLAVRDALAALDGGDT